MTSSTPSTSTTATGAASEDEAKQIVMQYKAQRAQITELANKINELDGERNEHALVVKAISPLDPSRRCYRCIGGVLVERTVGEVLPAVEKNLKGISDLIEQLTAQLKEREKESEAFRVKYNITFGGADDDKEGDRDDEDVRRSGAGGGGGSILA